MEMLNNILEFFNNYGWPGIVAIVLILVIYWLITKKDKSTKDTITTGFDKLATSISNQNEHLIDSITRYNEKTQAELFNLVKTTLSERDNAIKEKIPLLEIYHIKEQDYINNKEYVINYIVSIIKEKYKEIKNG